MKSDMRYDPQQAAHENYIKAITDFCYSLKDNDTIWLKLGARCIVEGTIKEWEGYVNQDLNGKEDLPPWFDDEALLKCFKEAAKLAGY